VGHFEYEVELSMAKSQEDMSFIAEAFRAGENKAVEKIIELIRSEDKLLAKMIVDDNYLVDLIQKEYNAKTS
jgi:hypothetical protein